MDFTPRDWLFAIGTVLVIVIVLPFAFWIYHLWIQYLFGKDVADFVTAFSVVITIIVTAILTVRYCIERSRP